MERQVVRHFLYPAFLNPLIISALQSNLVFDQLVPLPLLSYIFFITLLISCHLIHL